MEMLEIKLILFKKRREEQQKQTSKATCVCTIHRQEGKRGQLHAI
jgi:hypothetical protein